MGLFSLYLISSIKLYIGMVCDSVSDILSNLTSLSSLKNVCIFDSTSVLYSSGPGVSFSHNARISVLPVNLYNVLERKVVSIIQNGKT